MKTNDSKEHICDSCSRDFVECNNEAKAEGVEMDIHFGNGVGNDNIINCDFWERKN